MQILGVIPENNGWIDPETKFRELIKAIEAIPLPAVGGRILTRQKYYEGRIDELVVERGRRPRLSFVITDCDVNGRSRPSAKRHEGSVRLEDLVDIFY